MISHDSGVVTNTMHSSPDLELAQLSLTGRRYGEAEEKFTRLLSTTEAPQAWLGLGLAKLGKLPSRKNTPEEVAYCFNKALALAPDRKDEACRLALSVAKAMLQDVEAMLPKVAAAESASTQAFVAGFLHKGMSYLRASSSSANSRPTLFTNLDALHDSYRGSVLLDASSEILASAQKVRDYLIGAVASVRSAVVQIVPDGYPSKAECLAAADGLTQALLPPSPEARKPKPLPAPDYNKPYKSKDQAVFAGVCGGMAHRLGWNRYLVRLLFTFLILFYNVGTIWYIIEIFRARQTLPTKGIPRSTNANSGSTNT